MWYQWLIFDTDFQQLMLSNWFDVSEPQITSVSWVSACFKHLKPGVMHTILTAQPLIGFSGCNKSPKAAPWSSPMWKVPRLAQARDYPGGKGRYMCEASLACCFCREERPRNFNFLTGKTWLPTMQIWNLELFGRCYLYWEEEILCTDKHHS